MTVTAPHSEQETLAGLASIVGRDRTQLQNGVTVASPANAEEIARILRFANERGLKVVPEGSGSKLDWGNPITPDIVLHTRRLAEVREHAWQDLTCTVQAGCIWADLQRVLGLHRQTVAMDPLWADRATVGGVVATNDSGSLRLRYGGLRDLIIGMTVVLADGTIAKSGGKVVKNVAGYDLHKLFTGSFGTLGVITEVNFRLHPIEQHARTISAAASDVRLLDAPLRDLLRSQFTPSGIQVRLVGGESALDVRLSARPECIEEHAARLRILLGANAQGEGRESSWEAREQLYSMDSAVVLKASMLPTEICAVASELQAMTAAAGIDLALVAQAHGLMYIALTPPAGKESSDALIGIINHLRARLRSSGGSAVCMQVPDVIRGKIDVWDCQSDALSLMREIKRRFDPNRIMSPGRFVGGI